MAASAMEANGISDERDESELELDSDGKQERQWSLQAFLICLSAIGEDGGSDAGDLSESDRDSDGM